MSQLEKLIARLKSKPKDLRYEEVKTLLESLGYKEDTKGKTSGSRIRFNKPDCDCSYKTIGLHKPHGGNPFKEYQVKQIIESLEENGDI